jgi:hypothetical protein
VIIVPDAAERARLDALLKEYLAEPEPETREEWIAALEKWDGRVNTESLIVMGDLKGWSR